MTHLNIDVEKIAESENPREKLELIAQKILNPNSEITSVKLEHPGFKKSKTKIKVIENVFDIIFNSSITDLDISYQRLVGEEFKYIFQLPDTLINLSMKCTSGVLHQADFCTFLDYLPKSLSTLDLECNELGRFKPYYMVRVVSALKDLPKLTKLNISHNHFGEKSDHDPCFGNSATEIFFKNLPKTITDLDISKNKAPKDLIDIALNELKLNNLNISRNGLFREEKEQIKEQIAQQNKHRNEDIHKAIKNQYWPGANEYFRDKIAPNKNIVQKISDFIKETTDQLNEVDKKLAEFVNQAKAFNNNNDWIQAIQTHEELPTDVLGEISDFSHHVSVTTQ